MLPQDTTHLIQKPCYQWRSLCQESACNRTTQRPDNPEERQTAVVWTCLPFISSGQNHLARHSERGKKTSRQRKRWKDNIMKWTGQRAVENREKWRKLVAISSVVPQRPSRFRDRCDEMWVPGVDVNTYRTFSVSPGLLCSWGGCEYQILCSWLGMSDFIPGMDVNTQFSSGLTWYILRCSRVGYEYPDICRFDLMYLIVFQGWIWLPSCLQVWRGMFDCVPGMGMNAQLSASLTWYVWSCSRNGCEYPVPRWLVRPDVCWERG